MLVTKCNLIGGPIRACHVNTILIRQMVDESKRIGLLVSEDALIRSLFSLEVIVRFGYKKTN